MSYMARFELKSTTGEIHSFVVCAGCGALISWTDPHACPAER